MKTRPIIFNGEMVRALLGGRKSQTRRVIKPQPPTTDDCRPAFVAASTVRRDIGTFRFGVLDPAGDTFTERGRERSLHVRCPYGVPGVRLWVREAFRYGANPGSEQPEVLYRADHDGKGWVSPRYMPRWASRITLEVVDVRVERANQDYPDEGISAGQWIWVVEFKVVP